MKGFQFSVALSEFATAAALITIAACAVSYFYTKPPVPVDRAVQAEPTVINHYITVPAPQVHLKIVVSPPPKPEPEPKTGMWIEPGAAQPKTQPKVWDNDNMPSAQDPPLFRALEKP
jgi:hypothetical protein